GLISDQRIRDAELLNDSFERMAMTIGGTLRDAIILASADIADLLGLIDRGEVGTLERELERVQERIEAFKGAELAGSLGFNAALLEKDIRRAAEIQERIAEITARNAADAGR